MSIRNRNNRNRKLFRCHRKARCRRSPRVESLERRDLLSSVSFGDDGIVHVEGTPQADEIGAFVQGERFVVTLNGDVKMFPNADVKALHVQALAGNDVIKVDATVRQPTVLDGGRGNDSITGGTGNDYIEAGPGNDRVFAAATANGGWNIVFGGAGNDSLIGGPGRDAIVGGAGHDRIQSGAADDTLLGDGPNSLREVPVPQAGEPASADLSTDVDPTKHERKLQVDNRYLSSSAPSDGNLFFGIQPRHRTSDAAVTMTLCWQRHSNAGKGAFVGRC